ncbi:MAG: redoxin domain-containing protein [Sedimentisphaeraceae bacterium JB056]
MKNILTKIIITLLLTTPIFAQKQSYAPYISINKWITESRYDLDALAGQPYLVEFWATWCSPCIANMPRMEDIYEEYSPKGLRMIGLSVDRDISSLEKFVEKHEISYPIAADSDTQNRYGVRGIPAAFLVDAAGYVVWSGHPGDRSLDRALKSVFKYSPPPILEDIDLSQFKDINADFGTGHRFSQVYASLKKHASSTGELNDKAKDVINEINIRLKKRIAFADKLLERKKVKAAVDVYTSTLKNYPGVQITEELDEKIKQIENDLT